MDITVTLDGPFFRGQMPRAVEDAIEEAQQTLANLAIEDVHHTLDISIKNPTPYYETQIIKQRAGRHEVVHDRGIVYGPWLEGTSSRNARSSFKGYAAFRKARDEVIQQAPAILQRILARHLRRVS